MADEVLNDISHRRYNPLRGSWILVSPHRTKRPWQGQQESPSKTILPDYDATCYLCPGNKRAQGDQNPQYENTFVFVNDYSAVKEQQQEYESRHKPDSKPRHRRCIAFSLTSYAIIGLAGRLLQIDPVKGKCYVLTFSRAHNQTLADLTPQQIQPVIQAWTKIYSSHISPRSALVQNAPATGIMPRSHDVDIAAPTAQYTYMQIFENKGAAMGCSNPHPHGQIWTTTGLPEEISLELAQLQKYRKEHDGSHMLVDYGILEQTEQERIVYENTSFLAVCPWWAVWPFEVMIISKQHRRALVDFNEEEQAHLADAIAEVTRRYDNLFQTHFPYSMGLHQAPLDGTEEEIEASHFHIHFLPPLLRSATVRKFLVGYELAAEPQRDTTPEQAAKRLREECAGELYRKTL